MKHYTLYCHGSANIHYDGAHELTLPEATVPNNVTIVFYIPPGTVFDARSGMALYGKVRNVYDLDKKTTEEIVSSVRTDMTVRSRTRDYSDRGTFWVATAGIDDYPRICTSTENNEFVYNYNLRGMRPTDHDSLKMVSWGLHEGGYGGRSIRPLGPTDTSTLQDMMNAASADVGEGGEAAIHCIFCRVEKFETQAGADYAAPSLKTGNLQYVSWR